VAHQGCHNSLDNNIEYIENHDEWKKSHEEENIRSRID
jgi:hypothetical protein